MRVDTLQIPHALILVEKRTEKKRQKTRIETIISVVVNVSVWTDNGCLEETVAWPLPGHLYLLSGYRAHPVISSHLISTLIERTQGPPHLMYFRQTPTVAILLRGHFICLFVVKRNRIFFTWIAYTL